jgi:hypothetical protein
MTDNVDYSGLAEFERRLRKAHPQAFDEFVALNKARHEFSIAEFFLEMSADKSAEEFDAADKLKKKAKRRLIAVEKAWDAAGAK